MKSDTLIIICLIIVSVWRIESNQNQLYVNQQKLADQGSEIIEWCREHPDCCKRLRKRKRKNKKEKPPIIMAFENEN
jgi:hypothetical protein